MGFNKIKQERASIVSDAYIIEDNNGKDIGTKETYDGWNLKHT